LLEDPRRIHRTRTVPPVSVESAIDLVEDVEIRFVDREAFGASIRSRQRDLLDGVQRPGSERIRQRVAEKRVAPSIRDPQVLSVDGDAGDGGAELRPRCLAELARDRYESARRVVLIDAAITAIEDVQGDSVCGETLRICVLFDQPEAPDQQPRLIVLVDAVVLRIDREHGRDAILGTGARYP
jgi:hypothetical protein